MANNNRERFSPLPAKFGRPEQMILVGQTDEVTQYRLAPVFESFAEADASLDLTGPAGFHGFGDRWTPLRREQPLRETSENDTIKGVL